MKKDNIPKRDNMLYCTKFSVNSCVIVLNSLMISKIKMYYEPYKN